MVVKNAHLHVFVLSRILLVGNQQNEFSPACALQKPESVVDPQCGSASLANDQWCLTDDSIGQYLERKDVHLSRIGFVGGGDQITFLPCTEREGVVSGHALDVGKGEFRSRQGL